MGSSGRRHARLAVALSAAWAAFFAASPGGFAEEPKPIVIGAGHSSIVEYDLALSPLAKYVGLRAPTDVTPLPDGTILIADPASAEILAMRRDGTIVWRKTMERRPTRIRPRRGGGYLVSTFDEVVALDERRETEWRLVVPNVKAAVDLANGNVLVATNDRNGWLTELTTKGEVVWRSLPPGYTDATGRWVDEERQRFFSSVSGLDVAPDGRILTTDFDQNELRILSPRYQTIRSFFPLLRHFVDVRIGPKGELVAATPEDLAVWFELPGGESRKLETTLRPMCANTSPWGTLWVGFEWMPEAEVLNATALRERGRPAVPWWRRALPLPSIGAVGALLVALLVRGPELRRQRAIRRQSSRTSLPAEPAEAPEPAGSARKAMAMGAAFLVFAAGSYLAWWGIENIRWTGFTSRQWSFALGCALAGVALRILNGLARSARSLTAFVEPAPVSTPSDATRDWRGAVLVALSIASLGGCLAILLRFPEEQAAAVALWLQAQVWILAAAYRPRAATAEERPKGRVERWALLLILGVAIATRFWELGGYPDGIHHDHEIYGVALLQTLRGAWKPFFIMDPHSGAGYARPWLVPAMAALEAFGSHYWVLRLTAALWSVATVWAAYLLARELFNPRVGLIAALLVTVNHAILIYSRQPYVIESTAPFLLALWAAAVGMKRSSRLHWCLAGVLCGWSMLSVRQCTIYPFVGVALLSYLAILHPRWLWRSGAGLAWLVLGAAAVYLPMLSGTLWDPTLVGRLTATTALTNPDGSIRWEADLWGMQVGHSFGSLFYYGDNAAWQIGTGLPLCLGVEACLFGIGLAYLLLSWRSPATFVVTATIAIGIFLGSAVLHSPPTYYHFFIAMVSVTFVSAVACDRLLALTDRWRPGWRTLPALALAALLGTVAWDHLSSAWSSVRRPPPAADGSVAHRAHPMSQVARFVREHPDWRHYIVRKPQEVSARSPTLIFAIADSDVSDITTDLAEALPVPPVAPAQGASFIVLASRVADREKIAAAYPNGHIEMLYVGDLSLTVWVYMVEAEQVRRAYEAHGAVVQPVQSG